MAVVRNVALGIIPGELRFDAMIDSGATDCVVPPSTALALGFDSSNRLGAKRVNVVGGQADMDLHRLEYLRVGTAQVHDLMFGVLDTGPLSRFVLIGLSFIKQFRTTFDFDEGRVLFRSRT
jgi:clan AA aspartic protease (TIGR02281 family)